MRPPLILRLIRLEERETGTLWATFRNRQDEHFDLELTGSEVMTPGSYYRVSFEIADPPATIVGAPR